MMEMISGRVFLKESLACAGRDKKSKVKIIIRIRKAENITSFVALMAMIGLNGIRAKKAIVK